MAGLTLDELNRILVECAGEAGGAAPAGDIHDVEFEVLGYDSIALMETAARLERDYGIRFEDEEIVEAATPRILLELVNRELAKVA
ncbi:acyl carrier protein [Actinomadura violacea]|uniref:Acyl carrier protein n=1 Tax=Actinomadura violacea TaxID=2819934 RepID=A0ABS3S109_9ACTN|nr:acyl carrier protein [Actinomadura violacea]MBO2462632.1 acyl carrier protein [Actinomadura violacea]